MNKSQKRELKQIISELEDIKSALQTMEADEEEKYYNLPESLQSSERGEELENAQENLSEAWGYIDYALMSLGSIIH